ncbi:YHYH protein [Salinibacterium sp. NYA9b]
MKTSAQFVLVPLACLALLVSACTAADDSTDSTSDAVSSATDSEVAALFADGALTSDAITVDCTLSNGSESTCYQFEVASLSSAVDTEGPFCPETTTDEGGIWVWDGDEPGLYALDEDFWALMESQGFEFADADGDITIVDPAGGTPSSSTTENSCLQATPDDSYHLQVLIPTTPELLDEVTDLSVISQIGLAFDGVTIFGDAPSVLDTGGLPALDACGGHIDPSGYYHWHFGAESIQSILDAAGANATCAIEQDNEAPVALAYDGYVIYGSEEDGAVPTDLDECGGHVSDTEEFGEVYHYHLSTDASNLPLCRVGATAEVTLSSPDGDNVALPNGTAGGGGGAPGDGGPPDGEAPGQGN